MNRLFLTTIAAGFLFAAGCNKSPEGGAPGTDNSFKVAAPTVSTTVKQNETQTVTLSLERKDGFKDAVALSTAEPSGIKAELAKKNVEPSDKDVALKITAAKDAPLGKQDIVVTAKPANGTATTVKVSVDVQKGN